MTHAAALTVPRAAKCGNFFKKNPLRSGCACAILSADGRAIELDHGKDKMQVTQQSVVIETTNRVLGMLEQGGVCGRVDRYPLADCIRATGLTAEQLADAEEDVDCDGYEHVSVREVIERNVKGRCVRKGARIA